MQSLGFEPGIAVWKAQTNPPIYGDPLIRIYAKLHDLCNKVLKPIYGTNVSIEERERERERERKRALSTYFWKRHNWNTFLDRNNFSDETLS